MCCCPARLRVALRAKELSAESLESTLSPLIAVLGQTGTGKSHLALTLAGELRGEIVNFDSVQVHRGLDIGSAKLPESERRGVPHHLIDVVTPTEELTAGAYARLARPILEQIRQRGSFRSLPAERVFICVLCWKGSRPLRSAMTASVRDFAPLPLAGPLPCTGTWLTVTPPLPDVSIPTIIKS